MKSFKRVLQIGVGLVVLAGAMGFVFTNWSWVFSKRVKGEILEVERVTAPTAVIGRASDQQLYSFSVLIRGENGVLYSASSEDRQWAVAKKGYCVTALFFRYPPWEFSRGNTFFNARVEQLAICPGREEPPPEPSVQ